MTEQCVDDRDEAGCEYKKDGTCGHWVPYGDYCLKGVFRHVFNSDPRRIKSPMPIKAEKDCESEYDATLAILPDKAGMKLVADMIRHSGFLNAVVGMTGLQVLKMMNTEVSRMEANVFDRLSRLTSLDLRGNRVVKIDEGVFRGLSHLRVLSSDNHKLCCSYFHNRLTECNAPEDELSSCSDLLRLDFFRLFLWSVSILAISGNVGCLVYRCCYRRQTASLTTRVLLTNLAASDLLMGVYMMMIGAADSYYRGVYVSKEVEWRESIMCKVAGVVAFVSCEVSSFVIFLVTLDRFLVLCFPLKRRIHLTARSALSACSVAWGVGVALAVVPLVTQWEFYGQSGICLPLPITRQQFKGQDFAFGVFIFLNANLFLLIGAAQVCIYRSVRATGCEAGTSRRQQESAIARRLFVVVGTDFLCWFPIGLMGLLASSGTPIPGVINVWVAIFLLPINSALNPFLYTLNGLADRWRRQREEKRMKEMIGKLNTEIPNWSASTVKELTKICLRSKLVTRDLVLRWLGVREASQVTQRRGMVDIKANDTYRTGKMASRYRHVVCSSEAIGDIVIIIIIIIIVVVVVVIIAEGKINGSLTALTAANTSIIEVQHSQ
nr:hypothetical protein BaRGS_019537 [Batillaria attramentaria]